VGKIFLCKKLLTSTIHHMAIQLCQALSQLSRVKGVTPSTITHLPEPLCTLFTNVMLRGRRSDLSLSDFMHSLTIDSNAALQLASLLVDKGFLHAAEPLLDGDSVYRIRFGYRRAMDLPLSLKQALLRLNDIQLVEVKSEIGAGTRGASMGPDALKIAAFEFSRQFFEHYPTVEIQSEHLGLRSSTTWFAKNIQGMFDLFEKISVVVKELLLQDKFPVLIAGDHSTAGGTIAGIKMAFPESRLGVIWIDAHADIHSPYTTPSGNMHGMPLATAFAEDNLDSQVNEPDAITVEYWEKIKNVGGINPKLAYDDLVYIAVRDTEPPEDALLEKHKIRNITTAEVRSRGTASVICEVLERLAHCDRLYVSFDVDSMDPSISAGTGTPVGGGLTDEEAGSLIAGFMQHGNVCCFEICEINPALDQMNRMAENAFQILERATNTLSSNQDIK
jgi:arginase